MGTSDVYAQSFATNKMKPKRLINDLIKDLGYLYVHYQSYIFVKNNANRLIQIKVEKRKQMVLELFKLNYNCSNKKKIVIVPACSLLTCRGPEIINFF